MPQPSYAYGVARIRVLENRLIGRDKIERMVDAATSADVLKVLAETEYSTGVAEISGPMEYELLIKNEVERVRKLIEDISPNPTITDLFFLKHDIHNLKVLFKARYMETDRDDLTVNVGTIPLETIKGSVKDKNYIKLPAFIREAIEKIENLFSIKPDPQMIDIILDRAMFEYIISVSRERKNTFALEYFTRVVDLVNIKSLLRVKKIGEGIDFLKELILPHGKLPLSFYSRALDESFEQLVDRMAFSQYGDVVTGGVESYLKTGNLTEYERLADNYLLGYVKALKGNPFGLEPIVGYLLAKENEINTIRIIMVSKINNIPAEKIRERLRDVYV